MLKQLEYPFDGEFILKKSKSLKKQLLEEKTVRLRKRVAVLGGSTTHDIIRILELFLLNQGIEPMFYESEYGMYWEDGVFGNDALANFAPEVIFIHTGTRNIREFPALDASPEQVEALLEETYNRFEQIWVKLEETWHCPVIQNNFEAPFYRFMGNQDSVDIHGRTYFVNRLNEKFAAWARGHENFFINDIHYQSAVFGLEEWSAPLYWHMYKYALCLRAIPWMTHNLANIIKSIFGRNKKALVLDLDNTLWGGVVGDDGPENLEIGQETSLGQVYAEFQAWVKAWKDYGVMLCVASKNEEENALAGLNHPAGILRPEDFLVIRANWEPKSRNLLEIAKTLQILPESLVFADDNPAEREIVRQQAPEVVAPELMSPETYIQILDRGGYFEVTSLSEDDKKRHGMYQANLERTRLQAVYEDYGDYLRSLKMRAYIGPFEPVYMARIAQLTNKSNQFNLTTRRFSQAKLEELATDPGYLTLYGKLEDMFGDNGLVSVVIGRQEEETLHIELWLMSCRVLKRDMEYAMLDALVEACKRRGLTRLIGYYYPTAKNGMVRDFYALMGFTQVRADVEGNTVWEYRLPQAYAHKNQVIEILLPKEKEIP